MDIDLMAPSDSKFLKKEDFPTPQVLTIRTVTVEPMQDGKLKAVLYFNELAKGCTLGAQKKALLKSVLGADTDGWIGHKVRLSFDPTVMMGPKVVGGIKLECKKGAAPVKAPVLRPAPVVADAFDDSDDIPF
jgi:hypothetical protein